MIEEPARHRRYPDDQWRFTGMVLFSRGFWGAFGNGFQPQRMGIRFRFTASE
jgi:hypothetical protein